jgi:2',3'-cyclic-nucleotide 2'-phosphodiesterase
MKILMAGDCVGRAGRKVIIEKLAELRRALELDLIVLNVENAAGGFSITHSTAQELFAAGVDVMTSGNHIFDKKEALELIKQEPRLLRPVNYVPTLPGNSAWKGEVNGNSVAVINVQGRVFMPPCDDPFRAMDAALTALDPACKIILVDIHAETTAEKIALGRYLDGRVSAVVGTHTHVSTADEQILPGGTAYITDLGMTGPHDGVIGMKTSTVLERFLSGLNVRFEVSEDNIQLNGLLIEINEATGRAVQVERVNVKLN